ncbi:MAG: VOC family protein [Anaerolineae bacterium]|nr:VOC family protein [Anaerolineae bacterium]MCO5192976.1 VOC family protein [Anaerolineae bacterium]MCO5199458.1 VOC family protein [Anaerolineae bacterium]MCO5205952.1 VOC family protein [Anaerolineae bacterium]
MSNHPIVHIELSANDLAETKKFYSELFGWSMMDFPEMNYVSFSSGEGAPGGGFNPTSEQYPAGTVTFYVHTDDVSASKDKAAALGAKIIQDEMPIPGVGTMVFFLDPTGNMIALLQPDPAGM